MTPVSDRAVLEETEEDLPILLETLQNFKSHSRRPTDTAYEAVLRCSTDYTLRRGGGGAMGRNGVTEESDLDDPDASPDGLGWHLALAALRDAEKGGVDLGVGGMEQLLRVRDEILCLCVVLTLPSSPQSIPQYFPRFLSGLPNRHLRRLRQCITR